MSFEILHFNDSERIFGEKNMNQDIFATIQYVDEMLAGCLYCGELLRLALDEMGWRENGSLKILEGRRYAYKGFKKKVAVDGSLSNYEHLLLGLFRLQVGFDKGTLDAGIILLPAKRSEKSPYGSSSKMVMEEMEMLKRSVTVPTSIALLDTGSPDLLEK